MYVQRAPLFVFVLDLKLSLSLHVGFGLDATGFQLACTCSPCRMSSGVHKSNSYSSLSNVSPYLGSDTNGDLHMSEQHIVADWCVSTSKDVSQNFPLTHCGVSQSSSLYASPYDWDVTYFLTRAQILSHTFSTISEDAAAEVQCPSYSFYLT